MSLDEFSDLLYSEMESRLAETNDKQYSSTQHLRNSSAIILQSIARLKEYFSQYIFSDKDEEVNFFKNIKPKFLSKLIYYQKAYGIQSRIPIGSLEEIKTFYLEELRKINQYMIDNKEFFLYYRSDSNSLDEIYFLRKEPDSWLLLNFEDYETDLNFTTIYDHKLSRIIAFAQLADFIKESMNALEVNKGKPVTQGSDKIQEIAWTTSKVSLIELLYALQSAGACNNGTIDIKKMANHFEKVFNIELGNYYRVFQEIRIRKSSRTAFLDQLKERLIKRMDESDENPRFS